MVSKQCNNMYCSNCKYTNHNTKDCYRPRGAAENQDKNNRTYRGVKHAGEPME